MSHSLISLYVALSRTCNPVKPVLNKQLPWSLQWSFAFEGGPSLRVDFRLLYFYDLKSGINIFFVPFFHLWKMVKSFFLIYIFLCKKGTSVCFFTQFHKWYLWKKYLFSKQKKSENLFLVLTFFLSETVSGMLIQHSLIYWFLDWYNNPWNGMPPFSAGILPTHDEMCCLRLLYHWKKL